MAPTGTSPGRRFLRQSASASTFAERALVPATARETRAISSRSTGVLAGLRALGERPTCPAGRATPGRASGREACSRPTAPLLEAPRSTRRAPCRRAARGRQGRSHAGRSGSRRAHRPARLDRHHAAPGGGLLDLALRLFLGAQHLLLHLLGLLHQCVHVELHGISSTSVALRSVTSREMRFSSPRGSDSGPTFVGLLGERGDDRESPPGDLVQSVAQDREVLGVVHLLAVELGRSAGRRG